jgi:hypothetical protein
MLETGLYIQSYLAQKPLTFYSMKIVCTQIKECFILFSKKYFLLQPSQKQESKFSANGNKSKYFFCYNNEEILSKHEVEAKI